MQTCRYVFEHGIELRAGVGAWLISNASPDQQVSFDSPSHAIEHLHPMRPLLLTERRSYGGDVTWLLRCDGRQLFAEGISTLMQRQLDGSTLYPVHHLAYLLGAFGYHCQKLAELYVQLAARYCQITQIPGHPNDGDVAYFSHEAEPYFEFDALLGVARRAYDSTRYLLWPRFGSGKGSVPRSLEALLKSSSHVPSALHSRLLASWTRFGVLLTDYRDCINHYVPVDFGLASVFMRRHSSGAWTTMVRIPDNPRVRSKNQFTFTLNRDALTYAWELDDEVLALAIDVADATVPRMG